MATIDLTTQSGISVTFLDDPGTGTTTATFHDLAATVELGTLRMDLANARSIIDALQVMAKSYYPDPPTGPRYAKTVVSVIQKTGTVTF
jgi:hypothetical protein